MARWWANSEKKGDEHLWRFKVRTYGQDLQQNCVLYSLLNDDALNFNEGQRIKNYLYDEKDTQQLQL